MSDLEFCQQAIKRGNIWKIKVRDFTYYGLPHDGEKSINELGLSHGILNLLSPNKPEEKYPICWMGISYFRENARELVEREL